ncbi:LysM peptidoglycan-binding domain-containing protein [Bacteroides eggerthii]|uniref:muramidase family protein n=1 Tax=Bacteroides eggerthii TaxID=28111 RepID=UPI001C376AD9|nr:LysM domain-containing protein [Bacteroides eggerthii]MBV3844952.1 LysM peptidoglycan-binding domain-containing protein [Bacteroides eggerthii]MBV3847264.1 LysM peptidoglycan-binding domain-containing protein [Bacteroides eggerthii]MBV3885322.1 LysM peptidoglycan-binding domain-containing protein [Bacteroides eggerthii]MBV3892271.1 LysM peptidoglycan-binding domain-containing protein [Bacteroides eggerthii]MBV3903430.1 LysM peptidoglycan-binding domain-containing protein [Bacteroides eggert
MKTINRIFCSLLLAGACSFGVNAQENQSYFLHTIEKGQSLYSIASMYNISQADIVKLNPGSDDKIYVGRTLRIPRTDANSQKETFHTIESGETLYRLTVKYNVSAKDICDANPGLSAENFRIGQVIRIPSSTDAATATTNNTGLSATSPTGNTPVQAPVQSRCRDMHKVKRKETVFSISRKYGITEAELIAANPELQGENKIKKGSFLCIPYPSTQIQQNTHPQATAPSDSELFSENKKSNERINVIKAAVILPFLSDGASKSESAKMVEYYEGFLMAVDSLKRTGTSIDLFTYSTGPSTSSLNSILGKNEMKDMDIIFGPLHQQHIKPLADFADKHDIRLVIPFTSKDNTVFRNPSVYQINTPQSYLYSEVYDHFVRQFPNANVIFIEASQDTKDKAEFIKGLKEELRNRSIPTKSLKEDATVESMKAVLRNDRENIFIPTSGSNITLIKILPQLTLLVREQPDSRVHLFGYPEWQTYTKDHLEAFFELDTYFYSSFYTNNLLPAAITFTKSYRKWYGKEMDERYPKFGMLGFDTGYFFLKGLSRYGSGLEKNLDKMDLVPIQTGFKFQRVNNWGGFINRKVFFVRFTKNFELIKLDFD